MSAVSARWLAVSGLSLQGRVSPGSLQPGFYLSADEIRGCDGAQGYKVHPPRRH
jgi:hypothetical protein